MTYEQQIEKIREAIDDASQEGAIDASVASLFRAAAAAQALADDIYGEYLPEYERAAQKLHSALSYLTGSYDGDDTGAQLRATYRALIDIAENEIVDGELID
jgi:hypothetical protein